MLPLLLGTHSTCYFKANNSAMLLFPEMRVQCKEK